MNERAVKGRIWRLGFMGLVIAAVTSPPAWSQHPADWPTQPRAVAEQPQIEALVDKLLASMTLEEKIGQLIQADIDSIRPEDLERYPIGSILAGGNAAPDHNVRSGPTPWLELTDAFFRASAVKRNPNHVPIPVIFGIDAVHGHAKIHGATLFPHNVGLGAAHDPALIERIGRATAEEVSATGIDWTFAPTVAVVRDVRWGRSYESYSEDPTLVADYARAMVTGLQGKVGTPDFLAPTHTLASAKHFLGDGGTMGGRDQFDNRSSERTLRDVHGAGYRAALAAGDLIIMASYNGWQGTKMHANPQLLTEVLKGRWNFPGFVVGDWNAHEEIPGCTKVSCPQFLTAGGDMYMAPDSWQQLFANLLQQVGSGEIPAARVDDAVRRILRVKALAGVFEARPPKERMSPGALGSNAHRLIARQAVRESLVLLKNNQHVLPLDPHARVLVTGPGADDIGMQSGGWTVDWQGSHNTNSDFPGATSILAGIRAAVNAAGGEVVTQLNDIENKKPTAAIVVYGERPYAEFEGDRETLELPNAETLRTLQRLHAAGIPVISVLISGRPLWVNREINLSDAFVAAWLPGSEGGGIADVLFKAKQGAPAYDFTGRLSFSWPATAMPVTFDNNGTVHGAQFARGYGLTLVDNRTVDSLSENPQVAAGQDGHDTLFYAGHVTAPWSIFVADSAAQVRLTMSSQASPADAITAKLTSQGLQAAWSGKAAGTFWIGGRAVDLQAGTSANRAVRLHYRVDVAPRAAVILSTRCESQLHCGLADKPGADNSGVDVTALLQKAPLGTWQTLTVPLQCLQQQGARLDAVTAPFAVDSSGPLTLTFDAIRIIRRPKNAVCPEK